MVKHISFFFWKTKEKIGRSRLRTKSNGKNILSQNASVYRKGNLYFLTDKIYYKKYRWH